MTDADMTPLDLLRRLLDAVYEVDATLPAGTSPRRGHGLAVADAADRARALRRWLDDSAGMLVPPGTTSKEAPGVDVDAILSRYAHAVEDVYQARTSGWHQTWLGLLAQMVKDIDAARADGLPPLDRYTRTLLLRDVSVYGAAAADGDDVTRAAKWDHIRDMLTGEE